MQVSYYYPTVVHFHIRLKQRQIYMYPFRLNIRSIKKYPVINEPITDIHISVTDNIRIQLNIWLIVCIRLLSNIQLI